MDVARAARRLGSREVHVICLESRDEMPAHGYEVEEAEKEGIIFHPSTGPKKVLGVNGKVVGLETGNASRCSTPTADSIRDSKRFRIGHHGRLDHPFGRADLRPSFLREEDGVKSTPRGTIQIDQETLATSAAGIFSGGDVAFGPRLIIDAIADGRKPARSIHQYLRGNVNWQQRVRLPIVQLRLVVRFLRRHAAPSLPD